MSTGVSDVLGVLQHEPRARMFYAAVAQSSIGTGASYTALLILTYDRFGSAWAISLVFLAEMIPAMVLGPLLGAAADTWPRQRCAIVGDVLRAIAFLGIAFADSLPVMMILVALAGVGGGLFGPAVLAGLPSLVSSGRLPAATSLYSAITTADIIVGPALGALMLLVISAEALTALNAATFAVSALMLLAVPLGQSSRADDQRALSVGLIGDARAGIAALRGLPAVTAVISSSAAVFLFAGLFNVAELPFARDVLHASDAGFFVLVASFGIGIAVGSLRGAADAQMSRAKRSFSAGLGLLGTGFVCSALAPTFAVALATFALAGVGNGLVRNNERLIVQRAVPPEFYGRVFGIADALGSALFVAGFVVAPLLLAHGSIRAALAVAGGGVLGIWAFAAFKLRPAWEPASDPRS
jgi:MFS family permease